MLQEGDEDEEPSFHGDTKHPGKHDEKLENTSSSTPLILTVLLIIIVIVAVLLGAYYYRHSWYRGRMLDFRYNYFVYAHYCIIALFLYPVVSFLPVNGSEGI
jgi:hypothetical protein